MRNSKLARPLGLSIVAALSLMAFMAGSAQAGVFKINGGAALLAELTGKSESLFTLLVIPRNLTIICHEAELLAGTEIINGTTALGKFQFNSCLSFAHKSPFGALPCTVHNPEAVATLLPKLHGGLPFVQTEADGPNFEGVKTFTTVLMLGESCPLPESNPVVGSVTAKFVVDDQVVNLLEFSPAISTLMGDTLKYGGAAAAVTGTTTIELTGAHKGLKFGIA